MPPKKRNTRPDEPRLRLRMRVETRSGIALGPGRIDLLEQIDETGSLVEAAHRLEMSYMRAWTLIRDTNAAFESPLVVSERGGRKGGGATLTDLGREVLALYRGLERDADAAVRAKWKLLRRRIKA